MAPFTKTQLVLAETVADVAVSAMRVRLHGVRRGSPDLFVAGNRTYVLKSEGSAIKECRALGDTGWRPLPIVRGARHALGEFTSTCGPLREARILAVMT